MRIARYSRPGNDPAYGLVELAADGGEHPDTIAALTGDPLAGPVNLTGERHLLSEVRLLAPVIPRSKIVGVAQNYTSDGSVPAQEAKQQPVVFFKPNTSVIGPDDPIIKPVETNDLHFAGELAVVIGRICRSVPVERAAEVIFGYTIANDVTAHDVAAADGQWARAKGWDSFCPLGPWIISHLQLPEVAQLQLTSHIDSELKQDASTGEMIHSVSELIAYISNFTTLLPGDVILTGTPAGDTAMSPGQQLNIYIESIGTLSNPIVDGAQPPAFDAEPATSQR